MSSVGNELSQNQIADVMRRFPKFELSYETVAHKKVSTPYNICMAIPPGKKAFLWFTFFRDENVCFLLDLNREKKVSRIKIIESGVITNIALNTLLYGTIMETNTTYFIIEDIFYKSGIPTKTLTYGEKLGFVDTFIKEYATKSNPMKIVIPAMWISDNDQREDDTYIPEKMANQINYQVHHLQYRSLNKIVPYLNISLARKIVSLPSTKRQDDLCELMIPPPLPKYDFRKPQYKYNTTFLVKADLQFDIYHLYAFGKNSSNVYYGVAYIQNYKTSAFMNGIFRKIRENKNLDYIEESDDEDDFQETRIDKYVDLKKMVAMECTFHPKFKRWIPIRQFNGNSVGKIVHIGKLC